jgi:hypothetical protein
MRRTEVGGVAKRIEVKSDKGKREQRSYGAASQRTNLSEVTK